MIISKVFLLSLFFSSGNLVLFYPKNSLVQLSMGLVSNVESPDLGNRLVRINIGLNANFNVPQAPFNYSHITSWPGLSKHRRSLQSDLTSGDITAGVLYESLKSLLELSGYHSQCLERAICDLASHPLETHEDDVLTELLLFVLSPSVHDAFGKYEVDEKVHYTKAQGYGVGNRSCEIIFSNCSESFLDLITTYQ